MQTEVESPSHRYYMWTARVAWLSFFALILSLLWVNASGNFYSTLNEYQVQSARSAILAFTSMFTFARWLVAARWMVVGVFFSVALLIAWRKRNDWFALTVSVTLMLLAWGFVLRGDHTTWKYPQFLGGWASILHMILSPITLLSLVLLFFLFPNGRYVTRRLKWLALVVVFASFLFAIADRFRPEDKPSISIFGFSPWDIWISLFLGSMVAALAGQVYRYRRLATPIQQQQLKWVMVGLGGMLLIPLVSWPLEDYGGAWGSLVSICIELVVSAFLPLTIGFSILRYRLWDVDVVINRTLVYGTLTALILGFYGLSVGLASALLPAQNYFMLSIFSLGIAFLIVAPLRSRLQGVADRWLVSPRPELIEEALQEKPASSMPLSLAQIGWIATLFYLSLVVGSQIISAPDRILSIEGDYLIEESLKLAWLPEELFIIYANVILRAGVAIAFWVAAVIIFLRKRQDRFALAISFVFMVTPFGQIINLESHAVLNFLSMLVFLSLALFPFMFPDGRFIPRSSKWRVSLIVTIVAVSLCTYWIFRISRPEYSTPEYGYVSMMAALLVMLAVGLGSQIYRYRNIASPLQRLQTKWVLFGFGIQVVWILWLVLLITGLLAWAGLSEPWSVFIMLHLNVLGTIALPVTIAISITRYRLWGIDLLINRALVFGGLTLLVAGTYIILVGVLGLFFQSGENTLLSILATGLIAILFHPLRQRLQQVINRVMYGDRDDPASVLSKLGQRLAQAGLPNDVLPAILQDIAQALKLPYVAIRQDRAGEQTDNGIIEQGFSTTDVHSFPLVYQGQEIGQLLVALRSPGETFTPQERRLLENIAQQAGAAVYAAQLTRHLQESRLQLITSREEERRRIHRDLHDGLGPQLATLSLKLDAARNYLPVDPAASDLLLQELKGQVQDAIQDVRRLVYELRPPALDQLGLAPALREYAAQQNANGLQVVVEAPDLPDLPAAVEVAAYRIALESLTNAARHAQASHCSIRISAGEHLCLQIEDDGVGMPDDWREGVGLSSMRERTLELGGIFRLQSYPGRGTSLSIQLPYTNNEP